MCIEFPFIDKIQKDRMVLSLTVQIIISTLCEKTDLFFYKKNYFVACCDNRADQYHVYDSIYYCFHNLAIITEEIRTE